MRSLLVPVVVAVILLSTDAGAQAPQPVAHWDFESGAGRVLVDRTGNGHHGDLFGAPTWVPSPIEEGAFALQFGPGRGVRVPNHPDLLPQDHSYSISAWFRTSPSSDESQALVWSQIGCCGNTIVFNVEGPDSSDNGRIRFSYHDDRIDDDDPQPGRVDVISPQTVTDGRWHHVVAVRDRAAGVARLFLDGDEVDSKMDSDAVIDTAAPLGIAHRVHEAIAREERFFLGALDEIRIFDVALSGDDVRDLFLGGTEVCEPAPLGQGAWYRQCLGVSVEQGGIDPGRGGRGPVTVPEPEFAKQLMPAVGDALEDRIFEIGGACAAGMEAEPSSDPCERAVKQYTALLFNIESHRVQRVCDTDGVALGCTSTNVDRLLGEIASLINTGDAGACRTAAACADAVNEGNGFGEAMSAETITPRPSARAGRGSSGVPGNLPTEAEAMEPHAPVHPAGVTFTVVGPEHLGQMEGEEPPQVQALHPSTIRQHLAVMANPLSPRSALELSTDHLLTALSGGHEPEVRMEILRALVGRVDVGLEGLLESHLLLLQQEARETEKEALAHQCTVLLDELGAGEDPR